MDLDSKTSHSSTSQILFQLLLVNIPLSDWLKAIGFGGRVKDYWNGYEVVLGRDRDEDERVDEWFGGIEDWEG